MSAYSEQSLMKLAVTTYTYRVSRNIGPTLYCFLLAYMYYVLIQNAEVAGVLKEFPLHSRENWVQFSLVHSRGSPNVYLCKNWGTLDISGCSWSCSGAPAAWSPPRSWRQRATGTSSRWAEAGPGHSWAAEQNKKRKGCLTSEDCLLLLPPISRCQLPNPGDPAEGWCLVTSGDCLIITPEQRTTRCTITEKAPSTRAHLRHY